MQRQYVIKQKLPDEPGVYTFRDYKRRPLYIGRATSLRDRVKSYFGNDLIDTRGPRIVDMVTKAKSLSWQKMSSVLEAVLLESSLIKKYQPYYNVAERDDRSSQYVVITNEDWPRVFLVRARDFEQGQREGTLPYKVNKCFGPFVEITLIKEALRILRRLFPFRDKKSGDSRYDEFYRTIGRSPREDNSNARRVYLKNIKYLILFFQGKSEKVRTLVEKNMKRNAKIMSFEKAVEDRKLLYALKHINDTALLKRSFGATSGTESKSGLFRIEAYDVAHLSATNVVGAMSVFVNGQATNSEYRRFKLSKNINDDLASLYEILSRRLNHTEWSYPDLILVDGNSNHVKVAQSILKARRIDIPVVAVTKDDKHRAHHLLGPDQIISLHKDTIIAANAEAHRFALNYHRGLRRIQKK